MPVNKDSRNFFVKEGTATAKKINNNVSGQTRGKNSVAKNDDSLYKGRFFIDNTKDMPVNKNYQSNRTVNSNERHNGGVTTSQRWNASIHGTNISNSVGGGNSAVKNNQNSGRLYNTAKLRLINNLVNN